MNKKQIFDFVKAERAKGIDNSLIRTILLAKEYYEKDIDAAIEAVDEQIKQGIPIENQVNPFKDEEDSSNSIKKIYWGNAIFLTIIQLGIIYLSKISPIEECNITPSGNTLCFIYSIFPVIILILPLAIWLISFIFRRNRTTYTLLVTTGLSLIAVAVVYSI